MYRNKDGKRVRCLHRYKGLDGLYTPRFRMKRNGVMITEYLCQIKGCKHWQIRFIESIRNNQTPEQRMNQPFITKRGESN